MNKNVQIFMNSRRMRHIKRCNNFPCLLPEDVAQHSYFVAVLSRVFTEEYNSFCEHLGNLDKKLDCLEVLDKALCHDWDEAFTSDIPYVVKHLNPEVHEDLENGLSERVSYLLRGCSDSIQFLYDRCVKCKDGKAGAVVGVCDMMELAIYCYEECKMGNTALEPILKNCIYYLDEMNSKLPDILGWEDDNMAFIFSRVSPTLGGLYSMIKEYKFSDFCWCVDIESHE